MTWRVECADVIEWAERYEGPPFHAILSDPPYFLSFMNAKWDDDVAMRKETWEALAEHLLPGAFIMAFASSRGWHRLAVAIEDAGMRIFPSIFIWATGQSFPKATRLDTQIDRAAGKSEDRQVIGHKGGRYSSPGKDIRGGNYIGGEPGIMRGLGDIVRPATTLAQAWQGHRYGGQVLKDAATPIIVAQKPYPKGKKTWEVITESGAGAINIDGGRIGAPYDGTRRQANIRGGNFVNYQGRDDVVQQGHVQGRWPPNFALVHSPLCKKVGVRRVKGGNDPRRKDGSKSGHNFHGFLERHRHDHRPCGHTGFGDSDGLETVDAWQCVESCPVRKLGLQSGERKSSGGAAFTTNMIYGKDQRTNGNDRRQLGRGDKGTAARFFFQADWSYEIAERLAGADPVRYQSKASRAEREKGLIGHIPCVSCGGVDTETHINDEGREVKCRRCNHPTLKPISLCKWLATLLGPPPRYAPRRLLVPFCGTGSEMAGAGLSGCWEYILGVEMDADTCEIAEPRLRYWLDGPRQARLF